MDTIVAISTAAGVGAVALIRMSGEQAFEIASRIYDGRTPFSDIENRNARFATLKHNGRLLDKVILTKFAAPKSFTGENTVEIACHGGAYISSSILSALIECGARLAENGEFTRRAYLNGKTDLSAAEGIIELINAESEAAATAAHTLSEGGLARTANRLFDMLVDSLARMEAALDYPEEDLSPIDTMFEAGVIESVARELDALLTTYNSGKCIRNGINVVIAGEVNTGKSSILNALTGKDRAIVTDIAGTTTDVVEDFYIYNGVKVNLSDTAGLRATSNPIERQGIDRAKNALLTADIILAVTDLSNPTPLPKEIPQTKKIINVKNKLDKLPTPAVNTANEEIAVSALTGEGIPQLKQAIYDKAIGSYHGGMVLTLERHHSALAEAKTALTHALTDINQKSPDLIAPDLTQAIDALGKITGKTADQELIKTIFQKFCLGK